MTDADDVLEFVRAEPTQRNRTIASKALQRARQVRSEAERAICTAGLTDEEEAFVLKELPSLKRLARELWPRVEAAE